MDISESVLVWSEDIVEMEFCEEIRGHVSSWTGWTGCVIMLSWAGCAPSAPENESTTWTYSVKPGDLCIFDEELHSTCLLVHHMRSHLLTCHLPSCPGYLLFKRCWSLLSCMSNHCLLAAVASILRQASSGMLTDNGSVLDGAFKIGECGVRSEVGLESDSPVGLFAGSRFCSFGCSTGRSTCSSTSWKPPCTKLPVASLSSTSCWKRSCISAARSAAIRASFSGWEIVATVCSEALPACLFWSETCSAKHGVLCSLLDGWSSLRSCTLEV